MMTLPSHEEIAQFYATYNDAYVGGGSSGGGNMVRYAQRYLQLLREHGCVRGKLIDVGSSNNPFPNVAAREGFDVTVMDFVRPAQLSESVRFRSGNLNQPLEALGIDERYDIVTSWAVLEHVPDPHLAARNLVQLCKPGGFIFCSTPEVGTRLTSFNLGRSPWFYPPEHLCLWSPKAMNRVFESLGCQPLKTGRLELSTARYVARYGIGVAEAVIGLPVKLLANALWRRLRDSRVHAFQGIYYSVFQRAG